MDTEDADGVNGRGEWRLTAENLSQLRLRKTAKTSTTSMEVKETRVDDRVPALQSESNISIPPSNCIAVEESKETFLSILCQVFVPLLISGLAMVGAGMYLDRIQSWQVFIELPEIIILVPALLGLKGNLEMTLASRLSTEANLGRIAGLKEQWLLISGNLALVQFQAIVVVLITSLLTILVSSTLYEKVSLNHGAMICACSIITASIASLLLGVLTAAIIVSSIYFKINPDNVSTPIVASVGDIVSLVIFSCIASVLHQTLDQNFWISFTCVLLFLLLLPIWLLICYKNRYTKNIISEGWIPIFSAVFISTIGGIALRKFVEKFKDLSAFQPVINGVGGNLVSIQASKLSTALHVRKIPLGQIPEDTPICILPTKIFSSNATHALTSRVLISLAVPGHLAFVFIILSVKKGYFDIDPLFTLLYMAASTLQVSILLYLAYVLTHLFWSKGINPDNTTIPFLTSLGDSLGIIFLGLVFSTLELFK